MSKSLIYGIILHKIKFKLIFYKNNAVSELHQLGMKNCTYIKFLPYIRYHTYFDIKNIISN